VTEEAEKTRSTATDDRSTAELLSDLTNQLTRLVRAEMRLAMTELQRKGKRAGLSAALLGMAGAGGLIGGGTLAACAVLALALVIPAWLSALLVGAAILIGSGLFALAARSALRAATPPVPERALESVRDDIETINRGAHR